MNAMFETEKNGHCSIDIDYEFDAPTYFELGRDELLPESRQAELWFVTAGNYPPSPLLAKISFDKKGKRENIDAFVKIRDVDSFNAQMGVYACPDSSLLCGSLAGRAYDTFPPQDLPNDTKHAAIEGSSNPCYMKSTTSQLARQNLAQRSSGRSLFQRPVSVQSRSSEDPLHTLVQAAKRQKVAECLAYKVVGTTQQNDLLHKSSKKKCFVNCNSHLVKMELTIPREPVLETARRAKNFRAHRSDHSDGKEGSKSTFKALPLNRKIFESSSLSFPRKTTPKLPEFQEFKLKTSERAILRSMATTKSLVADNPASSSNAKDFRIGSKIPEYHSLSKRATDDKKTRGSTQKVQSQNHNEKINFSTSKRSKQHNPLSELFNKKHSRSMRLGHNFRSSFMTRKRL